MNTEDRLRRAANEMDRVVSSVSPPPIGEVRRSARMRNVGVAVAAAVGAVVLVGGSVLALRPGGETTISPAGPGQTTTTAATTTVPEGTFFEGVPVVVADLDPTPEFEMGGVVIDPVGLPSDYGTDIRRLAAYPQWNEFVRIDEIMFIGEIGASAAYALAGEAVPNELGDTQYACVLALDPDPWGVCSYSEDARLAVTSTDTFVSLVGWVGDGSSVVSMTVDGSEVWARTRQGYVFVGIDTGMWESVDFTAFAPDRSIVSPLWEFDMTSQPGCSGSGISPSALALSSVTQPVAQTLWEIVDAARVCGFTTLAEVGGGNVHASFGGEEPADLWAYEEENGYEPMYWLLSVLDLPYGTVDLGEEMMYVWPAAAAHNGGWDTMPEEYIDDLRALYTDDDFEGFRAFGGYIGYRVGITESGVWSFFVQGD